MPANGRRDLIRRLKFNVIGLWNWQRSLQNTEFKNNWALPPSSLYHLAASKRQSCVRNFISHLSMYILRYFLPIKYMLNPTKISASLRCYGAHIWYSPCPVTHWRSSDAPADRRLLCSSRWQCGRVSTCLLIRQEHRACCSWWTECVRRYLCKRIGRKAYSLSCNLPSRYYKCALLPSYRTK